MDVGPLSSGGLSVLAAPSSLAQPTLHTFPSSAVVVALRPSHMSLLEPLLSLFSPSLLAFFPSHEWILLSLEHDLPWCWFPRCLGVPVGCSLNPSLPTGAVSPPPAHCGLLPAVPPVPPPRCLPHPFALHVQDINLCAFPVPGGTNSSCPRPWRGSGAWSVRRHSGSSTGGSAVTVWRGTTTASPKT